MHDFKGFVLNKANQSRLSPPQKKISDAPLVSGTFDERALLPTTDSSQLSCERVIGERMPSDSDTRNKNHASGRWSPS